MDEENNELDASQKREKSGGSKKHSLSSVENKAKNIQKGAQQGQKFLNQKAKSQTAKAATQTGKAAAQTTAKAAKTANMAGKLGKVASAASKAANVAAKLGKILAAVGWIILIIIIIIGLLVFIIAGLGFIIDGLKNIAEGLWNSIKTFVAGSDDVWLVGEEQIIDTADYLEEMGYDLYGYGFVTQQDAFKEETVQETTTVEGEETTVEKTIKKLNYSKNGDVYKYLTSYLVSDSYAKTIRNNNKNLLTAFTSGNFFKGLTNSTNWGSGFITIYKEDNGQLGVCGDAYGLSGRILSFNNSGYFNTWGKNCSCV